MDERTGEHEAPDQPRPARLVENVETLKALADPTRMAILSVLTQSPDLAVMSVKELAATSRESERRPTLIMWEAAITPAAADELNHRLRELNAAAAARA